MAAPIDLHCESVSKRYTLRRADSRPWWRFGSREPQIVWAVRDVTFAVDRGETFGIIGHNGAGKSTLLKLMSAITAPTSGTITIRGRVSALIEVGSGFHPELSGRENIYLTGAILGMARREIAAKLDSIVEFAGVHRFLDMPVKWYSSGMYVRLGFAIAAHLEPDVLLVDEVLAVGDAAFQAKCLERIDLLRREGTTLVFISHDLATVARICDRIGVMHGGRLIGEGAPDEMVRTYTRLVGLEPADASPADTPASDGALPAPPAVEDASGCGTGLPLRIAVRYRATPATDDAELTIGMYSPDGHVLHAEFSTAHSPAPLPLAAAGAVQFECESLGLQAGEYVARATLRDRRNGRVIATSPDAAITIGHGIGARGHFYMPHAWRLLEGS